MGVRHVLVALAADARQGASGISGLDRPDQLSYAATARFFGQLRQFLGLSADQAAAHLQTYPHVITALETGQLSDLPPWPETRRIVAGYAAAAGIDPAPALHILERYCQPTPAASVEPNEPPAAKPRPSSKRLKTSPTPVNPWISVMLRPWPFWRITAVAMISALLGLASQSGALQATMTQLPLPLAQAARQMQDAVLIRVSGKFEGMPWIDVAEPRSRRSDKLLKGPR